MWPRKALIWEQCFHIRVEMKMRDEVQLILIDETKITKCESVAAIMQCKLSTFIKLLRFQFVVKYNFIV